MPRKERYRRMTPAQKRAKLVRQERRRLTKPTMSGRTRQLLGNTDYLTLYSEMLDQQGGGCAICGKPPGKQRLHIDHCHKTLKIRGLLCYSCNTKLGWLEKRLPQIRRYLRGDT